MASVDRDILTIVEPTIKVDEIFVEADSTTGDKDAEDGKSPENPEPVVQQESMEGGVYPVIQIGSEKVGQDDINAFTLKLDGFLPRATLEVVDVSNKLQEKDYPLDGTIVSVYLKPRPLKEYRPIRIDFDIASIRSSPPTKGEDAEPAQFTFELVMHVPLIFADVMQGFASGNSFDHLLECAEGLGLGFASNEDATDDAQIRICADTGRDEFIQDTTLSAYKDDESFFASYVDPHYYLSFVNVNKQFSEAEETEKVPIVTKNDMEIQVSEDNNAGNEKDQEEQGDLRLSNGQDVSGTNMEISSYNLHNSSGDVWMNNGYKRKLKYLNLNENNNGGATGGLEEFLVAPLNTPGTDENRIPLRGRSDDPDWEFNNKAKYLGKQPSEEFENVHSNYMYAIASNMGNNDEIEKLYMDVELGACNWSLYRYQRIPVTIYTQSTTVAMDMENRDKQLGENNQPPNNPEGEDEEVVYDEPSTLVKNEFLTGWYVISEITYKYNKGAQMVQNVKLLRREWPIPTQNADQ